MLTVNQPIIATRITASAHTEPHKIASVIAETALEVSVLGSVYSIFRDVAEQVRNGIRPAVAPKDNPTDNLAYGYIHMCTRFNGDWEEIVTLTESRRTAQAASAAVRRQKRELAVCVPITALFSDIPSNGLSVPINARIVPDTALSDEQAQAWQRLWGMLLSGETG